MAVLTGPTGGRGERGSAFRRAVQEVRVDVDAAIEREAGKPIAEIFADEGEAHFRQLEERATIDLVGAGGVVALGGGAVMNPAIREALVGHDVIWLKVSIGQASRRVGLNTARPLLMGNMRARLIELLRERTPVYEAVSTQVVETDGRGSSEVADQLAAERGAVL